MAMSRKDFEKVADILTTADITPQERVALARTFADWFETENPRFNRAMFLAAAGAV